MSEKKAKAAFIEPMLLRRTVLREVHRSGNRAACGLVWPHAYKIEH
jgi:hypothetical protein